jgi:hypothetical protein
VCLLPRSRPVSAAGGVLSSIFINTFFISRTPMRPHRRLSISRFLFALIFLAAFICPPTRSAQFAQPWNFPVNQLAEKIAAAAGAPPGPLAMNMTNSSSLRAPDASAIYDSVLAALRARRFSIASPAPANSTLTRVQVTFSEDATRYLLVAQVWTEPGADAQVAIVPAAKLADHAATTREVSVLLGRRVVWSQQGKILDFVLLDMTAQAKKLVLLEPERVAFYSGVPLQWNLDGFVPVTHAAAWPRDLSGIIDPQSGSVSVNGAPCVGDVMHADGLHCEQLRGGLSRVIDANQIRATQDDRMSDIVNMGSVCSDLGPLLLSSGTGDWSQPDQLMVYDAVAQRGLPIGQPFEIPGPVLAMGVSADRRSVRVVSRNLQTGMYEASIVTASCGN